MKKARISIFHFYLNLFNLNIFGEIVTTDFDKPKLHLAYSTVAYSRQCMRCLSLNKLLFQFVGVLNLYLSDCSTVHLGRLRYTATALA